MLASEFPHCATVGQRTGKAGGGALLVQSVFVRPVSVSRNETVPVLAGVPAGLSWPSVVQASVKSAPFELATVTFSFVGVGL